METVAITYNSTITTSKILVGSLVTAPALVRASLLVLVLLLYIRSRCKRNLPPGPRFIPGVGNMNLLARNPTQPYKVITELSKQYGPIMTFRFGGELAVIISDYHLLKQVFVENSDIASERPDIILRWELEKGGEVARDIQETMWRDIHKVNEKILHKVCIRRSPFEHRFSADLDELLQALGSQNGDFDPSDILTRCVTSISWHFCTGQRLHYEEPQLSELVKLVFGNLNHMRSSVVQSYCHVPIWLQNLFVRRVLKPVTQRMDQLSRSAIRDHEADYSEHSVTDVIGAIIEMHKRRPDNILFSEQSMLRALNSFMLGGVDSMQSVLRWIFLYFIHYPDIQERCYQDVLENVGENRVAGISDWPTLRYITATVYEALRHGNIAPLGVPHSSKVDLNISGYTIPSQTLIFSNQWAIHRDPTLWDRPDEFRPERWIGQDGQIIHHHGFIPFSIGPRHCPGEKFAKLQLVLLTAGILQRYRILPSSEHPVPDLEGIQHLSMAPKPYHVRLEPRTQI